MPDAYRWNPYALPWAIVALALFVLAAVIYRRQRASRVAVLFCAMIALVGGVVHRVHGHAPVGAAFAGGAVGTRALWPEWLCCRRRSTSSRPRRCGFRRIGARVLRVLWVISLAFLALTLFSHGIIGGVALRPWGWYPVAGRVAPLFVALFLGALIAHLFEGIAEYQRSADPKRKRRVAKLLVGFIVVYAAAIDFVPMFGVPTAARRLRPGRGVHRLRLGHDPPASLPADHGGARRARDPGDDGGRAVRPRCRGKDPRGERRGDDAPRLHRFRSPRPQHRHARADR